jgi:hypothetical protein
MKAAFVAVKVFRLHSFGNSGLFCVIRPANGEPKQSEISITLRKDTAQIGNSFPAGNCSQNKNYFSHINNK